MIQSSDKTISNMMSVILAKMGVHDRVEAAALARGLPGVQGRDTGRDG
jgi:DNA-binding NarL/FixJ family response regulator